MEIVFLSDAGAKKLQAVIKMKKVLKGMIMMRGNMRTRMVTRKHVLLLKGDKNVSYLEQQQSCM